MSGERHRVIIIGSGPAGCTAAIYTARESLAPIVIAGELPGGQLILTFEVENFPGLPEGIMGPELMGLMRRQAERFGAKFIDKDATKVDFLSRPFKVFTEDEVYIGETVIIATGASAKWLDLESEKRLRGRGVSACATCDGFFFREKDVAVVGGGGAALRESLFLTKMVNKVTVVHRRDHLKASRILQDRAFANSKIEFRWNSVVKEVIGRDRVEGILLEDVRTGQRSELKVQGVFVAIGHKPNTEVFKGQIELDQQGYVVLKERTQTSVEGVFAAGDVHDRRYRQAITAASAGCMAAIDVERYLESRE